MDRKVRIPVRFEGSPGEPESPEQGREIEALRADEDLPAESGDAGKGAQPGAPAPTARRSGQDDTDWRDMALRLQAEMDNYRKRQQRLARDQIQDERERLLAAFLDTVDNLERALQSPGDGQALRQGVQLTRREAIQFLGKEGVQQVEALGRAFDPAWHEAVATVGHQQANVAPETVVQVVQPGYRLGEQLLRPAKVVVAV
jgi:molecular chaperone GrpE